MPPPGRRAAARVRPARARWRRRCRGAHPGPRSAQRSHPSDDLLLRGQERAVWRGLLLTILRFALEAAVNNPAGPRAILLIGLTAPRGCRRQPDDAGILTPRRWRPPTPQRLLLRCEYRRGCRADWTTLERVGRRARPGCWGCGLRQLVRGPPRLWLCGRALRVV